MSWVSRSYRDSNRCDTCVHRQTSLWGDDEQIFAGRPWESPEPAQVRVEFDHEKNQADLPGDFQEMVCHSHCHPKSHHFFWFYSLYLFLLITIPYHVVLIVKTIERNTIDFGALASLQSYCFETLVNSPFLPRNLERWEKNGSNKRWHMLHTWHETCIFHQQLQVFLTICLEGVSQWSIWNPPQHSQVRTTTPHEEQVQRLVVIWIGNMFISGFSRQVKYLNLP